MSWENRNFKELGFIGRGKSRHRPRNDESLYGGDYPMIQTGDVKAANFYLTSFSQTYNEKGLSQSKLWEPNTLCITIAANIAETAILGMKACFPDSIIGFIADDKKSDVRFIKYFFDIYKERMQRISQGTTQDNLSLEKLLTFEVPTPPLQTQKCIADILSAYDDLIENNLKRIKLLEQAAQNIYKEWFVNLRFPGHENTPINEETRLPEGWNKINLYDFAQIQMGYAFKAKDFNDEMVGRPAIRIRDIIDNWTKTYTAENVDEKYSVEHGDILIGMDGIFHMGIWSGQEKAFLVQRVCRLRANNMNLQGYLLESLRAPIRHYEQTISGATVAHLGTKHLREIFIRVPGGEFLKKLSIFNTINSKTIILNKQNQKLKSARDILLPRLMNRIIEV